MKSRFNEDEIKVMKKIAAKFRKSKGYLTCLNGLARASGYKDWSELVTINTKALSF